MNRSVYRRPDKPTRLSVTKRERIGVTRSEPPEPVIMDKSTECHVTPPDIARRMVEILAPSPDSDIIEPSAGTGALCDALVEYGHPLEMICAIEKDAELARRLLSRFPRAWHADFLTDFVCRLPYDCALMNPPFKKARQHIEKALECAGKVVALVPVTFEDRGMIEHNHYGPDTFSLARVSTKIITIYSEDG